MKKRFANSCISDQLSTDNALVFHFQFSNEVVVLRVEFVTRLSSVSVFITNNLAQACSGVRCYPTPWPTSKKKIERKVVKCKLYSNKLVHCREKLFSSALNPLSRITHCLQPSSGGYPGPQSSTLTALTPISPLVKRFCHFIDQPPRTNPHPIHASQNSAQQSVRFRGRLETSPDHQNLFIHNACSKNASLRPRIFHVTSELLTTFSHHTIPVL